MKSMQLYRPNPILFNSRVFVIVIALLQSGNGLADSSDWLSLSRQFFVSSSDSSLSEAGSRAILNEVMSRSLYGPVYSESRVSGNTVSKVVSKHQNPPVPEEKLKEYVAATYPNATERERQMIVTLQHRVDVKVYQLGNMLRDGGLTTEEKTKTAKAADGLRMRQLHFEIDLLRNDALGNALDGVLTRFATLLDNQ